MNYRRLFIQNVYIFITIVTNNRISILLDNVDILKESFQKFSQIYKFDLFAYSIQKDHLHALSFFVQLRICSLNLLKANCRLLFAIS